ncbi:hypothetical protein X975_19626, partial [Stegodyphus mimosarum]
MAHLIFTLVLAVLILEVIHFRSADGSEVSEIVTEMPNMRGFEIRTKNVYRMCCFRNRKRNHRKNANNTT